MSSKADLIGSVLSISCIIHCILMPIVLPLFPVISLSIGGDAYFHSIMLFAVVISSLVAFRSGFRKHKDATTIMLAICANSVLIFALSLETIFDTHMATILTVLGGLFLVMAHYRNHKLSCLCRHHHYKGR